MIRVMASMDASSSLGDVGYKLASGVRVSRRFSVGMGFPLFLWRMSTRWGSLRLSRANPRQSSRRPPLLH